MNRLSAGERLLAYAQQREDYQLYVGVPLESPTRWARVVEAAERGLRMEGGGECFFTEVRAFLVAYPNGQVLERTALGVSGLPPGICFPLSRPTQRTDIITLLDLTAGNQFVTVLHDRCRLHPGERHYYSTTLKNISSQRIRILRFGGTPRPPRAGSSIPSPTTSSPPRSSARGMALRSGSNLTRACAIPTTMADSPALWAYFGEAEDGTRFVAGEVIEGPLAETD